MIQDKHFCITGILCLPREEIGFILEDWGGYLDKGIIKTTDYLVVGEKPGKSKLTKAQKQGVKIISDDDFMKMVDAARGEEKTKVKAMSPAEFFPPLVHIKTIGNVPDEIKLDLLSMAGMDNEEDCKFCTFEELNVEDLKTRRIGTSCGNVPNESISKSYNVFVKFGITRIILLFNSDFEDERRGSTEVTWSLAVPITGVAADAIGYSIDKHDGSARPDPASIPGWTVYESE